MLFHKERPAALCPFLLKWKQSGEKKLRSIEPPWKKRKLHFKKQENRFSNYLIFQTHYTTTQHRLRFIKLILNSKVFLSTNNHILVYKNANSNAKKFKLSSSSQYTCSLIGLFIFKTCHPTSLDQSDSSGLDLSNFRQTEYIKSQSEQSSVSKQQSYQRRWFHDFKVNTYTDSTKYTPTSIVNLKKIITRLVQIIHQNS